MFKKFAAAALVLAFAVPAFAQQIFMSVSSQFFGDKDVISLTSSALANMALNNDNEDSSISHKPSLFSLLL